MTQTRLSNEQTKRAKSYKAFMINRGIVSFNRISLSRCYKYSFEDSRFNMGELN